MYALADCNNFFVSCERVFRPDLRHKPVVVLSNNDGCVIARSNESKQMGIKMGMPYFQIKEFLKNNKVTVFSSNHILYGDMSRRVMALLSEYSPETDIYSIDECFMDFTGMGSSDDMVRYAKNIVRDIAFRLNIPVSIGIAPTKTLAKVAAGFAKKFPAYNGACIIDNEEKRKKALSLTEIGDVWGIGRKLKPKLEKYGIRTAGDFAALDEAMIQRTFNRSVINTWRELNGSDCITPNDLPHNKSICVSRSFAKEGISDKSELESATARFAADCAEKLRKQKCVCSQITVFARTSRFISGSGTHYIYHNSHLPYPTQDSGEIISVALAGLRSEYIPGTFHYKKAGVMLWDIAEENACNFLFDEKDRRKQALLNSAIDAINAKNGRHSIRMAVEDSAIRYERAHMSRQYTTDINDILVLKV